MKCSFRQVGLDDIDLLRQISVDTFKQSYEHLNSPENFNSYLNKAFHYSKLIEEIRNPESTFYFVEYEDRVVGYLKVNVGNSQTERFSSDYLEVERLYLEHIYQGRGLGREMITYIFSIAKRKRKSRIWLGVWEQNPKAIEFYTKMGFREKGSHIFQFGNEDQVDIIMEIDLKEKEKGST